MAEAGVASTFVVYGSARIPSPEEAATMVNAPEGAVPNPVAQSLATKARYYAEARELGRLASSGDHDDGEGPTLRGVHGRWAVDYGGGEPGGRRIPGASRSD